MLGPRLPPELFDKVIDVFAPPPTPLRLPDDFTDDQYTLELAACAQVCRGWHPRAQMHLYAVISTRDSEAMFALISTLTNKPSLTAVIHTVIVDPPAKGSQYFPLARLLALHPRLEQLMILNIDWGRSYPSMHAARLGHRTSVAHLTLFWMMFPSLVDLLRLVRSFNHLSSLSIHAIGFTDPSAQLTIDQLQARRTRWAPASLRVINAKALPYAVPLQFLGLLGSAVEDLFINKWVHGDATEPPSFEFLSQFGQLKNIRCRLRLERIAHSEAQVYGVHGMLDPQYTVFRNHVLELLDAVRSPHLCSLQLDLRFLFRFHDRPRDPSDPNARNRPSNRPRVVRFAQNLRSRSAMLDGMFGRAFHDAVVDHPAFQALSDLRLVIPESTSRYDAEWWRVQIEQRLPRLLPGTLRLEVTVLENHDEYNYGELWVPEPGPDAV